MRMLRLVPALLLALMAAAPPPSASRPAGVRVGRPCKPDGPLAVRLIVAGPLAGARVSVEVELQPVLELQAVSWCWELSPGVQLLGGAAQGTGDAARGAVTRLSAELSAPAGQGRARLLADARFAGFDADGVRSTEEVTVVRTLEWGEPPVNAPRVRTADPEGGGLVEVVALPVAQRAGR